MLVKELKNNIIESLISQGFSLNGKAEPRNYSKNSFRKIHSISKKEQILLQKNLIETGVHIISKYLVNGKDINPNKIDLELRSVQSGTEDELIYRWWNLVWWSMPYQKAYGRQMRFILWDKTHNAPFGLIGLQSPVFKMSVRDNYLKIPDEKFDVLINMSMQAQRLGALPPYNQLLGGKMVALALTSNEIRKAYKRKYRNVTTLMQKRRIEPELLFITTTSAFGRSSIYNRLNLDNIEVAKSLGYTKGSGTFQISQNLYKEIQKYLIRRGINVNTTFGNGPSRKIKLISKALSMLELGNYTYHNIKREFFLFTLVKNIENVISKDSKPQYYNRKLIELVEFWKKRWCNPRSERYFEWKNFNGNKFSKKIMNTLKEYEES